MKPNVFNLLNASRGVVVGLLSSLLRVLLLLVLEVKRIQPQQAHLCQLVHQVAPEHQHLQTRRGPGCGPHSWAHKTLFRQPDGNVRASPLSDQPQYHVEATEGPGVLHSVDLLFLPARVLLQHRRACQFHFECIK